MKHSSRFNIIKVYKNFWKEQRFQMKIGAKENLCKMREKKLFNIFVHIDAVGNR